MNVIDPQNLSAATDPQFSPWFYVTRGWKV